MASRMVEMVARHADGGSHRPSPCRGGVKGAGAVMAGTVPHYVQWGLVSITVANLVVLGLMFVVFAAALALRLPEHRDAESPPQGGRQAE